VQLVPAYAILLASVTIGARYVDARETYDASSPIARVPRGVPHLVVCAVSDDPNLLEISRDYAAAAAGFDDVESIEGPGGHFHVIDPGSEIWRDIVEAVEKALAS
jgi:hypothetical protein